MAWSGKLRFVNCAGKAARRVRRRGNHGLRGLLHQPVSSPPHQPAHRPLGRRLHQRMQLPLEIVARTREAVGKDFTLIYRLSMIDLVPDGSTWDEVVQLGRPWRRAGPPSSTPASAGTRRGCPPSPPACRAAFAWVTAKMKAEFAAAGITTPLVTSNRINTPEVAEDILANGMADMVSLARPLLADARFAAKAAAGQADLINTCIACNQACLDHVFQNKASCLVNPAPAAKPSWCSAPWWPQKRVAVVGAGPAGMTAAIHRAERGHAVTLFDAAHRHRRPAQLGQAGAGQRRIQRDAALLPAPPRHHRRGAEAARVSAADLHTGFEHIVIATGITRATRALPGKTTPRCWATWTCCATTGPWASAWW